MSKLVVWFKEVDKDDLPLVGGKGANLGEMYKIGIPVPNGFIVTSEAYYAFIKETGVKDELQKVLHNLDTSDSDALEKSAKKARDIILKGDIPKEISKEIIDHYHAMGKVFYDPLVAVRSSATAEDLPDASFAGQQDTYLNVKGEASVVQHVRRCWSSLFTARAIFYRVENKFDHFKIGIAVPVQQMVQSDTSGIMFTVDPINGNKESIIIEAIYGLGEMIVQGAVTPDHFEVKKDDLEIMAKNISTQEKMMTRVGVETVIKKVPSKLGMQQKINEKHIKELATLGKKLEKHYYFPQDIEWAIEKNKVYITQTRPITTLKTQATTHAGVSVGEINLPVLLQGDPASPGLASGTVQMVKSAREIEKIQKGDVLVAPQTNPDYVPAMRKVSAIITESGGRTSHAAIVSRELGIPAVVGAKNALKILTNKQVVTVHGTKGIVYKGGLSKAQAVAQKTSLTGGAQKTFVPRKTATKLYVNLAEPEKSQEVSKYPVDGVGLLRAEFMIAGIGTHPKKFIKDKKQHVFVNQLAEKLELFCKSFSPRPVVYRATDFRTNEYRNLVGGKEYEPEEANPMLGYRGAYRYIHDPRVFELELEAIKLVRNKHGYKNLWLMIPFVHTPEELAEIKKIVAAEGLSRSPSFKLWMMCELPANVISLDKFIDVGIDGVSIGSNDLTMLILGVDRDNSEVAHVFNERNPAVLWALEHVIRTCHKRGVTVGICGQAPSDYPELVEKLVEWGITSISVNRDVAQQVRETIYQAEQKLLSKHKKI